MSDKPQNFPFDAVVREGADRLDGRLRANLRAGPLPPGIRGGGRALVRCGMSADSNAVDQAHASNAASEVARDFVTTANSFADSFSAYIAQRSGEVDDAMVCRRRSEACAAVWAAIVATFEASALTDQEKARIVPLVRQEMLRAWNRHCAVEPTFVDKISSRSTYYLRHQDRTSQLTTATNIMRDLLESIDPEAARALPARRLAAVIAHRMLVDLSRLNDLKAHGTID
jgi:hypothetical protein